MTGSVEREWVQSARYMGARLAQGLSNTVSYAATFFGGAPGMAAAVGVKARRNDGNDRFRAASTVVGLVTSILTYAAVNDARGFGATVGLVALTSVASPLAAEIGDGFARHADSISDARRMRRHYRYRRPPHHSHDQW